AFDAVKSCGCFGDAIPLTPWQSFIKDLILLVLIIYIYIKQDKIQPVTTLKSTQKLILNVVWIAPLLFGLYTWYYLPVIDFLPYKEGVNVPEAMKVPEGALQDEYEITYILKHKSTGEEKK